MRFVFVLALAGAMVNTGVESGPQTELDQFFATYQLASLDAVDGKPITDRFPAPPQPAQLDLVVDPVEADRYPVAGDAMVDSMIRTNRSVLAVPVPEVPIAEVCDALAAAAEQHGLPVAFLARLIWQESRFRQSAVSPVGAQGVAQFMPRIAAAYGLENPFNPLEALAASARFLRELRDSFGNLGLAAAAYNGGAGRVQNWLARRNRLPEETRNYVRIVTGHEPEKWTVASANVDLATHLPQRAPCEGTAGLARDAGAMTVPVALAGWVTGIIRKAEEAAATARAAAAKAKLLARAKGSKKSLAAKSKGKAVVAVKGGNKGRFVLAVRDRSRSGKADSKSAKPALVIAIVSGSKHTAKDKSVKAAAGNSKSKVAGKPPNKAVRLADAHRNG